MASGKQSRRKRREAGASAPPPVRSKGGRRQASPRALALGAGGVVIVVVAVVLAVVLSGGSSSKKPAAPVKATTTAAVKKLLVGIAQSGNVLGSPKAPVTLAEYVDLQCPFCQEFETQSMPTLIAQYVRAGKVKVEARPIAFIGPDSVRGREVVLAAARQNHMFDFMEYLYLLQGKENTGWLTDGLVASIAAAIPGLDAPKFQADRTGSAVKAQSQKLDTQAQADNVTGTPTILVGKSGQQLQPVALQTPTDTQSVIAAITAALG